MNSKRSYGFSLAEVLLSLAIMSMVMLTLVSVLTSGLKAQEKTDNTLAGQAVANQVMDRLLWRLANEPDSRWFWEDDDYSELAQQVKVGHTTYSCEVSAETITTSDGVNFDSEGNSNGLKMIEVRVRWAPDGEQVKQGVGKLEVTCRRLANERHESQDV